MKLTFETALVHLKQGKKIRRAFWPKQVYLKKQRVSDCDGEEFDDIEEKWSDDENYFSTGSYWFVESDLLEEDWEVVE